MVHSEVETSKHIISLIASVKKSLISPGGIFGWLIQPVGQCEAILPMQKIIDDWTEPRRKKSD